MRNRRTLKRDMNNVFGDIIEAAYLHQLTHPEEDPSKADKVVDEAIENFDSLIAEVNNRNVENKKQHFRGIERKFEERAKALVEKVNAL